jgi:hypothetical protein
MDTPLVFSAKKIVPAEESEHDQMIREGYTIATLRVVPLQISPALMPSTMAVEKKAAPKKKKGFWGFLSRMFGG